MGSSIDPLLGIAEMKKANGVVLASGEVPALLLGVARSPLTMPPLSASMMDDLLAELLTAEERAVLAATGAVDSTYRSEAQGAFGVRARQNGEKLTLTVARGGIRQAGAAPATRPPTGRGAATVFQPPADAGAPGPAAPVPVPAAANSPAITVPSAPAVLAPADSAGTPALDPRLQALLDQAMSRGASDLLLSAGARPFLRVDGDLVEASGVALTARDLHGFFATLVGPDRWRRFEATGSLDFGFSHGTSDSSDPLRVRGNLFRHLSGVAAALRPLRAEIPTLAELQLPESLGELCELPHGLVLVTGASGAGKSTTLAALLERLNRTRPCHIVTLEDPIEYRHRRQRALIHQREVGEHVESFAAGLRAALRENPDVLLVGEMRDAETIRLALTAAQTGHLVLSTLHSGTAVMAIERIIDVFAESEKLHVRQELAMSLRQVVAQQLLPSAQGGRVPALERLTVNHAVAAQIRDGRTHMLATQIEIGGGEGMIPLERALADLVRAGRITRPTALAAASNREALQKLLDERPRPVR
jgi:twitching motility protein PilT